MNTKQILVLSGVAFGIAIFFEYVTPPLFNHFLKSKLNLLPGSDLRQVYRRPPLFLNSKVYLFNLTNPDEVTEGGKPKLQEIGPYFFGQVKKKFHFIDDDDEDTLTFHYKNYYKFRPDLSGPGLTGNEIITMPHPLVATMLLAINVDKKEMLTFVKTATDIIFKSPEHVFYTGRVMDILFDGIPIDCSSDEFHARAVCSVFESGDVKVVQPLNSTHCVFSLLSAGNATDAGEMTVFRGRENSLDVGRIVAFDNEDSEMDVWDGEECNEYRGTDATIFPPYMNGSDSIWLYEPTICRSFGAHCVGESEHMGLDATEFALDIGSAENSKQCYCQDKDKCPKKGTFDMFPCIQAPMIGSQPHFYNADPSVIENFESGIQPEKEKHETHMHVEMTTGTLLSGVRRLQYNLEIVPIEEIPYMEKLREMYYPLFWIEESMTLSETYVNQIKNTFIFPLKIQKCLKWTGFIFGSCVIIISLWNYMKNN